MADDSKGKLFRFELKPFLDTDIYPGLSLIWASLAMVLFPKTILGVPTVVWTLGAYALIGVSVLLKLRHAIRSVVIGKDGLMSRSLLGTKRFLGWGEIESIVLKKRPTGSVVALKIDGGEEICLWTNLKEELLDAARDAQKQWLAKTGARVPELSAGEDFSEWVGRVDSLGQGSGYRDGRDLETLSEVAADPSAPKAQRLGAALRCAC